MLLTLTSTQTPATDLGYLLHKHPDRFQTFPLTFGNAHVFYPEATESRCTAALLLEVDPVGLVRGRRGPAGEDRALEQYVNDRPYVASSFLSVAIAQVFGTALSGRSQTRPEAVAKPMSLEARLAVLSCRGGESLLHRLFSPLGYQIEAQKHPLDPQFPQWGDSRYLTVTLRGTVPVQRLLAHLYVLLPVLDDDKHYWVGADEVEKLLRHGDEWLSEHPERELIVRRYLKHQRRLTRAALAQLTDEDQPDPEAETLAAGRDEDQLERPMSLRDQRMEAILAALHQAGAHRVLDLGCGDGRLLGVLLGDPAFTEIVGMDVSHRALEIAHQRLDLDRMPERKKARLRLIQGSLTYRDQRLAGYDAAAAVEVIEHLDPPRLEAFERVLFGQARPGTILLTTPNAEYNVLFEGLPPGKLRHRDHRFEWTRAQFQAWAEAAAGRNGYTVRFTPIGPQDPNLGSPTQMAIFTREAA